jgi:hypothetical protein
LFNNLYYIVANLQQLYELSYENKVAYVDKLMSFL